MSKTAASRKVDLLSRALNMALDDLEKAKENYIEEPIGYEDGTAMVMFTKQFNEFGQEYTYAAVRIGNGKWYLSGSRWGNTEQRQYGIEWETLLEWVQLGFSWAVYAPGEMDLIGQSK